MPLLAEHLANYRLRRTAQLAEFLDRQAHGLLVDLPLRRSAASITEALPIPAHGVFSMLAMHIIASPDLAFLRNFGFNPRLHNYPSIGV
jgi:hypothetical protein